VLRPDLPAMPGRTWAKIAEVLRDGVPRSTGEIAKLIGLNAKATNAALRRAWKSGKLLRSEKPLREIVNIPKGRRGSIQVLRTYYLYTLRPEGINSTVINGVRFVAYSPKHEDVRARRRVSKAKAILEFLRRHSGRAWFSKDVYEALKDEVPNLRMSDIMATVRRYEHKGLLYVRGYKMGDKETPFKKGYLIAWIDQEKPRDEALREAFEKTEKALMEDPHTPILVRARMFRDLVLSFSMRKELVSFNYIVERLGCTTYEAEEAVKRALQLYQDIKCIRVFGVYRYYYHAPSFSDDELRMAVKSVEEHIRISKGREQRIGHNWEAAVEWFIDKFAVGVKFWEQKHKGKDMDPRRIIVHLLKPVGRRRRTAELDRVFEVQPLPFLPMPLTFIVMCKWGKVRREHIDEAFEVVKWTKEFGVETEHGRKLKQGVVILFAAPTFDEKAKVRLADGRTVGLAAYAAMRNIWLIKPKNLDTVLRLRGYGRVSVRKICEYAANEDEVRELLDRIWAEPERAEDIIAEVREKNKGIFDFEKRLQEKAGYA